MRFQALSRLFSAALLISVAWPSSTTGAAPPSDADAPAPQRPSTEAPHDDDTEPTHDDEPAPARDEGPRPGKARNNTVEPRPGARPLLWVPRTLLFVPRWVFWAAVQPLRLGIMAYERNHVYQRFIDLFFNEARTFGVLPIVRFQRFQGSFVGARLVHRNLFGTGGGLSLESGLGDRLKQEHILRVGTGNLLGPYWGMDAWVGYAVRSRENFTGIGNAVLVDLENPGLLPRRLDPYAEAIGIRTRFREDTLFFGLGIGAALSEDLSLHLAHAWKRATYADGIRPSENHITDVYDPATLPGFDTGVLRNYTEIAATYDSLRTTSRWIPPATPSRGWRIRGYYGVSRVLMPRGAYWRTGLDVGRFIDLYRGDRVLRLRLKFDLLQGGYETTPFTDLPTLGGTQFLRGYRNDRFRDRLAALSTAEYWFPASSDFSVYLFTDVGRVYSSLEDLSLRDLQVGFGGGVQLHDYDVFIARIQIASSTEGSLYFQLRFEPTFVLDETY